MRSRRRRHSSNCHCGLVELGRPGRPALEHVGTVDGVAVEEVRDVPDAREAPGALDRRRVPDVLRQWCEPRFVEVLLDHLDERPYRTLGNPGVVLRVGTCRARQRSAHQRPREREGDVGAHAVVPALACPQVRRQALGQPPLDAACRHRDHLGGHRVVQRVGHQTGQLRHQGVGPFGSVDTEHPRRVRRRCSRPDGHRTGSRLPPARGARPVPRSPVSGSGAPARSALGKGEDDLLTLPGDLVLVVHLDRLQVAGRRVDR